MGALVDAVVSIETALAGISMPVIVDPRSIRPSVVLIEPPSITGISAGITHLDVTLTVTSPPPGDRKSIDRMLDTVDEIIELIPISAGQFGLTATGGQELPSYQLTAPIKIRRT